MLLHVFPLTRASKSIRYAVLLLGFAFFLEVYWHVKDARVVRPAAALDVPFQVGCQEPDVNAPRENAAIVMLARNQDLADAISAINSLEEKFNRWFHYPIVFLNDKPWSDEFIGALRAVASGPTKFEVVPEKGWDFPDWMDRDQAVQDMAAQGEKHIYNGGIESYHHMCRFYSGYVLSKVKSSFSNLLLK